MASQWMMRAWLLLSLQLAIRSRSLEGSTQNKTKFFKDQIVDFELSNRFSSHPMLFFSDTDIITLQHFANTSHSHLTENIRNAVRDITSNPKYFPPKDYKVFGLQWNEGYGNNLPVLALYVLLHPNDLKAFAYVRRFLDRLEFYKHWQVLARFKEDLPVAHALAGFATAVDMLYPRFDATRKLRYIQKIRLVTEQLYDNSFTKPWGYKYLNHRSLTNYVAILFGSLVCELHTTQASIWKQHSITMLERNLQLLSHVKDGSFSEGVGYGANSFRALSQYLYLLRRHLRLDHTNHPWLHQHFNFYLYTALPGLRSILGVADSAQTWVYGPESQLHFLDSFVKKTGKGHWLAAEIRKRRNNTAGDDMFSDLWYQKYVGLHLEFIWFNPSIHPRPPSHYASATLHEFPDWGVATYRSGALMDPYTTFLSFKAGRRHGLAIYNLIHHFTRDEHIRGWDSFDVSHEHPDQNSFSFWPNGVPFVTEGHYGPKYPYLDNTVMFAPASLTPCSHPFVGQLGSCSTMLHVSSEEERHSEARLLLVSKKQAYAFIAGEAAESYHPALKVASFYRALLLLHRELLVVVDHIQLNASSPVTHASSVFNNFRHSFISQPHDLGLNGLVLGDSEDLQGYKSFWISAGNKSPFPKITNISYPGSPESGTPNSVSNAKITFALEGPITRLIYVFHGPNVQIRKFKITRNSTEGISFLLDTGYQNLFLNFATDHNVAKTLCSVTDLHSESTTLFTARTSAPDVNDNSTSNQDNGWNGPDSNKLYVKQPHMRVSRDGDEPDEPDMENGDDTDSQSRTRMKIANLSQASAEFTGNIRRAKLLQAQWSMLMERELETDHELMMASTPIKPSSLWYSLLVIAISNLTCCLLVLTWLRIGSASQRRRLMPALALGFISLVLLALI